MTLASRTLLLIVLALTALMLFVGLNPRGFDGDNGVRWDDPADGARFDRGIAFTAPLLRPDMLGDAGKQWTWQVALRTVPRDAAGFGIAAVLHSGRDDTQIQIAQWSHTLVVMVGDDYARRHPGQRLHYELAPQGQTLVVTVVHGDDGVRLYVNGEPVTRDRRATWPAIGTPQPARLVLGGTPTGQLPWRGSIRWITLVDRALSDAEVGRTYLRPISGDALDGVLLDFDLADPRGREVGSTGSLSAALHAPVSFTPPVLRALTWPDAWWPPTRALVIDVAVNFVGFVPFGFFAAWFCYAIGRPNRLAMVLTIAGALGVSLTIELAQVWLPTRDSSLLDLLMNGLGAAAGALAFVSRPRNPRTFVSED